MWSYNFQKNKGGTVHGFLLSYQPAWGKQCEWLLTSYLASLFASDRQCWNFSRETPYHSHIITVYHRSHQDTAPVDSSARGIFLGREKLSHWESCWDQRERENVSVPESENDGEMLEQGSIESLIRTTYPPSFFCTACSFHELPTRHVQYGTSVLTVGQSLELQNTGW